MKTITVDSRVLNAIVDETSKEIYRNRVAYSNGSNEAMEQIIRLEMQGNRLIEFMQQHKENLYIFGAGILGENLANTWTWKYNFKAFIDNDRRKQGKSINNIPVISLEDVQEREEAAIIIMTKFFWDEMEDQLYHNGFCKNQIFNLGEIYRQFNENQYFDLEYLNVSDDESFVDCGALDGETSLIFFRKFGSCLKKVWLFEPDKGNVQKCRRNFENTKIDYEIIEKGVWSSSMQLRFTSLGNGGACIDEKGTDYINTITLDEVLENCNPTFIKMDIEGAELEALKGAQKVIKRYQPKLAISVYHKYEDIAQIPQLLLDYYPDYKFYLRHYSLMNSETILYAL